ncbi:hypothetical protein UA08_02066 [Talaromyces atroroseus]|uniref:ZZ-type domain-containing protein n=1 Tax=Talaromyces atroroseus TaxID=1441469 RepID=A0A1Q5QAN3_TALAT|nr:hypothetical protein UA08_02066 [Talaromyces atroroseus]OKL62980.1 hypothetical protein UA08_02066 [Talaromyces atroroseus]
MPAMAAVAAPPAPPVGPDTLITIKILQNGSLNRRLKMPLRDLGARVFPQKIRQFLSVPPTETLVLERYSDSFANYILLDSENPAVYKQLYRAAKAKLKLRIKATTTSQTLPAVSDNSQSQEPSHQPYRYLETVLSSSASPTNTVSNDDLVSRVSTNIDSQSTQTMTSPLLSQSMLEEKQRAYPFRFPNSNHPSSMYCIDCNNCGGSILGEHYHCSICDGGDYDLCSACVDAGVSCPGEDHWLLKRLVQNGVIINSTTETIAPKRLRSSPSAVPTDNTAPAEEPKIEDKETVVENTKNVVEEPVQEKLAANERTCNACFRQFSETTMRIVGVRHKCMTCPDWDYCWSCMKTAEHSHPQHRFVPIYESISEPSYDQEVHYGIYCDGPLCRNKSSVTYITGVRYKCAICHDTDFCAACEALPNSTHNRTHPLIKLRTPVRNVSVSTMGGDGLGGQSILMGDRSPPVPPSFVDAATSNSISTVVEAPSVVEKVETEEAQEEVHEEMHEEAKEDAPQADETPATPVIETAPTSSKANLAGDYSAYFMRDTIPDGTSMASSHVFEQTWTLYNPGPSTWPVGTSVRFVGGDAMFNVNTEHPSSAVALAEAMSSNETTHPIAPSDSANFSVTLKSPRRLGTSISYWRLKLPNGTPFGHKLWCDIKVVDEPKESETPLAGSNMVFPKLEKESPVSSIHQALSHSSTPAFTAPVSNTDEQGILEDVESLTLEDVESDDDGFLTDEEYDILDASDQESFSEKHI